MREFTPNQIASIAEQLAKDSTNILNKMPPSTISPIRALAIRTRLKGMILLDNIRPYLKKGGSPHSIEEQLSILATAQLEDMQFVIAHGLISNIVTTIEETISEGFQPEKYDERFNTYFPTKLIKPVRLEDFSKKIGHNRITSPDIQKLAYMADQDRSFGIFLEDPHNLPILLRAHFYSFSPKAMEAYKIASGIFVDAYNRTVYNHPLPVLTRGDQYL